MSNRQVLGIDFDGVIHWYRQGDLGQENVYDEPVPGALEFINACLSVYDIFIVSARASSEIGREAIRMWLDKYGFPSFLPISDKKPSGELLVMIDDRAIGFNGKFPSLQELSSFKPWWRK